jgi:Flp pilus assembly pilin Flp
MGRRRLAARGPRGRGDGAIEGSNMIGSLQNAVWRVRRAIVERVTWLVEERGAATAEYTLVTLVAATIAFLLLNWAKGGALTDFFQKIFDKVVAMFN